MAHAVLIGQALLEGATRLAEKYPIIGDVRGRGMFLGIDLVKDRATREPDTEAAVRVTNRFKQEQVLLQSDGPHNNVLKFKSPLVFDMDNVKTILDLLDTVLGEIEEDRNK